MKFHGPRRIFATLYKAFTAQCFFWGSLELQAHWHADPLQDQAPTQKHDRRGEDLENGIILSQLGEREADSSPCLMNWRLVLRCLSSVQILI